MIEVVWCIVYVNRMLQQILEKMEVEPELLAELGDEHKQILFRRIREEQVRRWKARETQLADDKRTSNKPSRRKQVNFLVGSDGEPIVAIIGMDEGSKPWSTSEVLNHFQFLSEYNDDIDSEDSNSSTEHKKLEEEPPDDDVVMRKACYRVGDRLSTCNPRYSMEIASKRAGTIIEDTDEEFQAKLKQEEQELFKSLQTVRFEVARLELRRKEIVGEEDYDFIRSEYEQNALNKNELPGEKDWEDMCQDIQNTNEFTKEEEEKARKEIQEVAERGIGKHKLNVALCSLSEISSRNSSRLSNGNIYAKPASRTAIVEWFRAHEAPKRAGLECDRLAPWFHGIITRAEAEERLSNCSQGSFLVRVSERIWGYAISYQDTDRCKHFLVESSNNQYKFFPSSCHGSYSSLNDLIKCHSTKPITDKNEVLLTPCLTYGSSELLELYQGVDGIETEDL